MSTGVEIEQSQDHLKFNYCNCTLILFVFLIPNTQLPRAKDTAALSGGGVKRFVKSLGDTMFSLTTKMSESDQVLNM